MTNLETAQILTILRAAYPRQTITAKQLEEMVTVWGGLLKDIPFEVGKLATEEYCAGNNPFFPAVGQIRTMALDMMASDADRITAGDAWDEVGKAFREIGSWGSPDWSHPDIGRAVDAVGGWQGLCHSQNSVADRARFLDIFKTYRARAETDRRMLPETRAFVAQHRQIEDSGPAGLIEAGMKQLTERMTEAR